MKATLAKALALVIGLALALSGCNLIGIDPKMQADEDIAKIDKDFSAVAATYDGGEITAGEAVGDFNSAYSQMYYFYSQFGYQMDHDQVHELIENTLEQHVRAEIAAAHYDAEHELSAEELADVESQAQESADANAENAKSSVEGKTDEEIAENVRVLLHANGMDYDALYANGLLNAKLDAMEQLLRDEITELTDEELQTAYDDKVAEQKESYTDGRSFENAMTGDDEIVCWVPDGYRTVKHILLKPADDVLQAYTDAVSARDSAQTSLDDLNEELETANDGTAEEAEETEGEDATEESARTPEEIQADIDAAQVTLADSETAVAEAAQACLDDVKATSDEIYERLDAGDSFEDLIAEYGEDPGMQNEPTMTRGYYVSAESQNWEANFRDAAMALNQVGDYTTEPVVSGSGVHIIAYTADVAGGEVALDEVHDALYDETLETAKEDHATETIDGWVEDANPSYDADAFEGAVFSEEE